MTYQWKFNAMNISGAVLPTLIIPVATIRNAGSYSVVVADGTSTVVSSNATVSVINGLKVSGPKNRKARLGRNAAFTVKATGTGPITYQWLFNGAPITGATTRQLLLYAVQPAQQGSYAVLVTNPAGTVKSSSAVLTVY
jgi:hypothetical protein